MGTIVVYRAATLSFTHDESGTYLFFHENTIWELFTNRKVWFSANNHILNSILAGFSHKYFGYSAFTIRFPNLLSFILYAYFLFKIGQYLRISPVSSTVAVGNFFCKKSKRGLIGLQPIGAADEFPDIKDLLEE